MRAVRSSEGIVDVKIAQAGQLFGKPVVVLFFFRVEAKILEQQDVAVLKLSNFRLRRFANAVVSKCHGLQ